VIAGVVYCLDEADIIGRSIEHHLNEGVDHIYAAHGPSSDGTGEILAGFAEVTVLENHDEMSHQQHWTDLLAALAAVHGATWIVPFDADEFWCWDGGTLADYLTFGPRAATVAVGQWWHHRDWEHRYTAKEDLNKVAYRWTPSARIGCGNHFVEGVPGSLMVAPALQVRHLRYRSFEQFAAKVRQRIARLPADERAAGHGWHHTQRDGLTDAELAVVWTGLMAEDAVYDPIPE
jgi:hypothetical protein